jgi:hypothetical protein
MKIKDLPQDVSLVGTRFIYPKDNKPYYWFSQWQGGVWGKEDMKNGSIHPLFVNDLNDVLEWEVVK